MSGELHALTRAGEWRCACSAGIRAASCRECLRCGAKRPTSTGETLALTRRAIEALDVFDRALRMHGNRAAAMAAVLEWTEGRGDQ